MSYAAKTTRGQRAPLRAQGTTTTAVRHRPAASAQASDAGLTLRAGSHRLTRPRSGYEPETVIDWQHVAIFGAGTLLGVTLGAGAALLFAPKTGRATRRHLARSGRRWRSRTTDAWDNLRDELHFAARRGRRKLERAIRDRWQRRGQDPEQPTLDD